MSRVLLAYLATWQSFDLAKIPAEKLTHLCYAFAKVVDGEIGLQHAFAPHHDAVSLAHSEQIFIDLQSLKQRNPELKIMISLGGWSADGFSDAALTEESRAKFTESAVQFMLARQLDGIDVDWEYPCNDMASIVARPEDKRNFSLMLESLRARLDAQSDFEGRQGTQRYLLTIAAGAGQYYLDGVEIDRVAKACDFINLMTYDFYNGWAKRAGHHANLYTAPHDPDGDSADKGVQLFIANGVPREKLVLGCPMYGRTLNGVGAKGLGELGLAGSNGAASFRRITNELLTNERFTRHWDEAAQVPWLFDGDQFVSYEDCESITLKGQYAVAQGLAGTMFWELTEDDDNALLDALWLATR